MAISEMRKGYTAILKEIGSPKTWSNEDRAFPFNGNPWLIGLTNWVDDSFNNNKDEIVRGVFGYLAEYVSKSYSVRSELGINPAVDLLVALERGEKDVRDRNIDAILRDLFTSLHKTKYQRCGTSTVRPFVEWIKYYKGTLKEIREDLTQEIEDGKMEKAIP